MILTSKPGPEATVQIKRVFSAPRDKVFRAWTEPKELKKWWRPGGCLLPSVEMDLQVGGRYRFGLQYPPDDVFYLSGTYREVQPPKKLVFTWRWEKSDMDVGESLVTIEFYDLGQATEVVLTHETFPHEAAAEKHHQGWDSIFECLTDYITKRKEG